jgi:hypothetical protein
MRFALRTSVFAVLLLGWLASPARAADYYRIENPLSGLCLDGYVAPGGSNTPTSSTCTGSNYQLWSLYYTGNTDSDGVSFYQICNYQSHLCIGSTRVLPISDAPTLQTNDPSSNFQWWGLVYTNPDFDLRSYGSLFLCLDALNWKQQTGWPPRIDNCFRFPGEDRWSITPDSPGLP